MSTRPDWKTLPPLIAILRGIAPHEVIEMGDALFDAGFRMIEIPLNSPSALTSIEKLSAHLGDKAWIGAGTVLHADQVEQVYKVGGRLIVSPNFNEQVVLKTKSQTEMMLSFPGIMTVTEAFSALLAGADGLKLFPAEAASPTILKAMRAVIPTSVSIFPVGGITPDNMKVWIQSGANGFGLGSALYKVGDTAEVVAKNAKAFIQLI